MLKYKLHPRVFQAMRLTDGIKLPDSLDAKAVPDHDEGDWLLLNSQQEPVVMKNSLFQLLFCPIEA